MTPLAFKPDIAADIRAAIEQELCAIEDRHDVRLLFAVESGSRAWGFPSPDSDYDVRFIYVHPLEWYLKLQPGRDVIELPISDDLDINGWDLRKALTLLMRPNPVLLEWLSSPVRYRWNQDVCAKLGALAEKTAHQGACLYHYLNLGQSQWSKHVGERDEVSFKKYFYILRPALAIRWIRLNPDILPPMNLQALVAGLDLDETVIAEIDNLLRLKAKAKEIGAGQRIAAIDDLIHGEFEWAETAEKATRKPKLMDEADALFQNVVTGAGDG
ncbi:MAG: nucleotidyltransferase domain-containing protein [Pseudomonadota bacterium]